MPPIDEYAIYVRKSRADTEAEARGEGETLARHNTMLTALAAKNGHVIGHRYMELVSGETIADRPQMQRLLQDVAAKRWAGIYVMEVERLARGDTSDQGRVARTFMFSKTPIITPAKTYDPSNEFDEEYFEFSLFMSRREYKTINRRIQAGRMQSVREGKYICSRPAYGYQKIKIPHDKGYTLKIIPQEAQVVRLIFNWYLHGDEAGRRMGLTRIANRLLDMHVDPGEQGSTWKPCRIHRMLSNEVYIGMIRWGRVQYKKELTEAGIAKKRSMTRDYQLYKGLHPAIISEEDFQAVQKRLPCDYTPLQTNKQLSNPLAGLVICSGCGHTLRGKPAAGRQPAMLFCATHGCKTVRTSRQEVEDAILDTLREWLASFRAESNHDMPARTYDTTGILQEAISKLEEERKTLLSQRDKLHDLLEQGTYTPDVFAERMATLKARIQDADNALADVQGQLSATIPAAERIALLAPQIQNAVDGYESAETAQEKNDLLKSVIEEVRYEKSIPGSKYIDAHQFQLVVKPRLI